MPRKFSCTSCSSVVNSSTSLFDVFQRRFDSAVAFVRMLTAALTFFKLHVMQYYYLDEESRANYGCVIGGVVSVRKLTSIADPMVFLARSWYPPPTRAHLKQTVNFMSVERSLSDHKLGMSMCTDNRANALYTNSCGKLGRYQQNDRLLNLCLTSHALKQA